MSEVDPQLIERAEEILGHHFENPELLVESLTHSSVADDRRNSNERLEFLGDAILGAVACEYLFHHYPDYMEGELTKIKSAVVSRRVCADLSNELDLTGLLLLGKGMSTREKLPSSLAAAVYESVVAALDLDAGLDVARRFIIEHLEPIIQEAAESAHQQNFKSVLQQHAQKHLDELPTYRLLDEKGPDHSKAFEVCAEIGGRRYPAAWGNNKKQAEQHAALLALADLGVVEIADDGRVHMKE